MEWKWYPLCDVMVSSCHRNANVPWVLDVPSLNMGFHQHLTKAISGCLFGYSVFDLQRRWGQLSGWSLRSSVIKLEVLLDLGQSSWSFPHTFNSPQSLSSVQLFVTSWTAAHQASLSITNSRSLLKLMSVESVMPYNHLILCRPLLLPPSIFPSNRVFSNESALRIRWPKSWSLSFSISPSNEHSGLISFRMDWLDLLAVQGTLKSLLQHHSSKASIIRH